MIRKFAPRGGRNLLWASAGVALLLALIFNGVQRYLARSTASALRQDISVYLARAVGDGEYEASLKRLRAQLAGTRYLSSLRLWVIDAKGEVVVSAQVGPERDVLPDSVRGQPVTLPAKEGDATFVFGSRGVFADVAIVKLAQANRFLLIETPKDAPLQSLLLTRSLMTVVMLLLAAFGSLLLVALYFRQKSREARVVFGALTRGDLRARFRIGRIEEAGELMQEFNRMADEIERLVQSIRETEEARQELLRELSHDLRTPLTSLRTSVETLSTYGARLSAADRDSLLQVMGLELRYFFRMVEDLFFIAEVANPRYKNTQEQVDLCELLAEEARKMEAARPQIRIRSPEMFGEAPGVALCFGDPLLLRRFFRNALENASRFARSEIRISIVSVTGEGAAAFEVVISDDGPGFDEPSLASFGKRRGRRIERARSSDEQELSLGLGSVIMQAVARVHEAKFAVRNRRDEAGRVLGADLVALFPSSPFRLE